MKTILEFNLPEDLEEYKLAFNGAKYHMCWDELFSHLRKLSKYENKESVSIDEIRQKMVEIQNDVFSD
jgi:hypothetical protein